MKERNLNWLDSIYSDGTDVFVSNPLPKLGEIVKVSLRFYEDSPVDRVFLRIVPNGSERLLEMHLSKTENGFAYYETDLFINETEVPYHFYLKSGSDLYFYNQKGVSTFFPERIYDFRLIADYDQPSWIKESVFYQIFPDRFYNGNPDNDVLDGEIEIDRHKSIQIKEWDSAPLDYEQGHCLDFYGGDLEGIREKIPYLKNLGINALYLNPIFTAPSSHKYDCIDYFSVDRHFGGDEALAALSKACHENGIRLIIDVSINHTGSEHIWFNRNGVFYDKSVGAYNNRDSVERSYYFFDDNNNYKGWYDLETMPTLNYTSDALRNIVYRDDFSVVRKWLKAPYNIDGWRFDVADVFARNDAVQLSHEVWPEIRNSIKEENKDAYILAEDWDDCNSHLLGSEWDSPMNYYGCARIIRQYVGGPELVLERYDIDGIKMNISAEDVRERITSYLAKLPFVIAENQFNLLDSHDVSRLHNLPGITKENYRSAVIMQFTLIGAPSIYYGDEAEIDGRAGSNEGCRYPMPWSKDFEKSETFKLYHDLAQLKKEIPALSKGGMKFIYARDKIIALARLYKNSIVVALTSMNESDTEITLDLKQLGSEKINCDLLGNKVESSIVEPGLVRIRVPAYSSYLLDCSTDN